MREITKEFFELLWFRFEEPRLPDGYLTIWHLPDNTSAHFRLSEIDAAIDYARTCDSQGRNTYYGVGLRNVDLGPSRLGREIDVTTWPGVWVDIDIAAPSSAGVHASESLPPSLEAVTELLWRFPIAPTMVIHSGYGLHIYYLFERPYVVARGEGKDFKRLLTKVQTRMRELFEEKGWHLDNTAKTQQVLRIPGLHNYKVPSDVQDVHILVDDGPRYAVGRLDAAVTKGPGRPAKSSPPRLATGLTSGGQVTDPTPGSPQLSGDKPSGSEGGSFSAATPAKSRRVYDDWRGEVCRRATKLVKTEHRELALLVLDGDTFAQPGSRNDTCNKAVGILTYLAYKVRPEITAAEVYEFFRPSIDKMSAESNDRGNPALHEDQVTDQIARAIEDAKRDEEIRLESEARLAATLNRLATRKVPTGQPPPSLKSEPLVPSPAPPTDTPPTDTPTDTPPTDAPELKIVDKPPMSRDEIRRALRLLIIQHKTAYFIMRDGRYQPAVCKEELEVKLRDDFENETAVSWFYDDANGNTKRKKLSEFLNDYCTVARHLVYDMTIAQSWYEPETETFFEAVCPIRELEPQYDAQVHEWLVRFGGTDSDKLIDWVSTITDLGHQTCALYLSGFPGTGKSMLAHGLARLWTESGEPTELLHALSSFNADIMRCPLILADEHIPGKRTSAELRVLVGSSSRTVSRKFMPNATLRGALRLMLAANNERMLLLGDEDLDLLDLEAVAGRFLHIQTPISAREYLETIGGKNGGTRDWVDGDRIAKHALWLRDHKREAYVPGKRFLVEGHQTRMHKMLVTQSVSSALVTEWIVKYLAKPITNVAQVTGVICGGGELLVNTVAVSEFWDNYIASHQVMSTTRIGRALHNISQGSREIGNKNYWIVRTDIVLDWARAYKIGNVALMQLAIDASVSDFGKSLKVIKS